MAENKTHNLCIYLLELRIAMHYYFLLSWLSITINYCDLTDVRLLPRECRAGPGCDVSKQEFGVLIRNLKVERAAEEEAEAAEEPGHTQGRRKRGGKRVRREGVMGMMMMDVAHDSGLRRMPHSQAFR